MVLLPAKRRVVLHADPATIDLNGTDVECYGSRKDGIAVAATLHAAGVTARLITTRRAEHPAAAPPK